MSRWPNFDEKEFRWATPTCSLSDMDATFMDRLQTARDIAGVPFKVNSAYRSVDWEKYKNRSGNSMHCLGRAIDISCRDSKQRHVILNALLQAGFNGIGIGRTFIHVDDRGDKMIWLYD